jgi:protein involved in ribonucleotide reduction
MIVIVVDSMTGQGRRFADKLGYPVFDILSYVFSHNHEIFLITRSYNFGEITKETLALISAHQNVIFGVAVSGNRNWGKNYGAAGDKIQLMYGIPLILKFEGLGFPHEIQKVKSFIEQRKGT